MLGLDMATFSPVQALVGRSIGKLLFARNKRLMAIGLVGTSMAILGLEATILDPDLAFLDPEWTTTLPFWTTTFPFWAQSIMFRNAIQPFWSLTNGFLDPNLAILSSCPNKGHNSVEQGKVIVVLPLICPIVCLSISLGCFSYPNG